MSTKEEAEEVKENRAGGNGKRHETTSPLIADCGEERTGWRRIKIMPEFPLKNMYVFSENMYDFFQKHVRVF